MPLIPAHCFTCKSQALWLACLGALLSVCVPQLVSRAGVCLTDGCCGSQAVMLRTLYSHVRLLPAFRVSKVSLPSCRRAPFSQRQCQCLLMCMDLFRVQGLEF